MFRLDEWLAYVAGIIDGEGSIMLQGTTYSKLRLVVGSTNKDLTEKLYKELGGTVRKWKNERIYKSGRIGKQVYQWSLCNRQAAELLFKCYPYLIVKKRHVEIIAAIRSTFHLNFRTVPDWELERRKGLYNQLKELNRKGVTP